MNGPDPLEDLGALVAEARRALCFAVACFAGAIALGLAVIAWRLA